MFRLITSADKRITVEELKEHPFFYGVDWESIRRIDAPFVPRLQSVTDTSYFPTDELDQVAEDSQTDSGGASKDLAFLGSVYLQFENSSNLIHARYTFKRFSVSSHA